MNTLQRPLFDAPMPMVEGSGITSMAMDEAAGQQLGADLTTAIAQGVAETESAIDAADDNIGIMNALRGKQASEEEYRTELAGYVGRKDANATPDSVLALVQPTIAMMELGDAPSGGIAEMMPPQTFGIEEDVFGKLPVQKLRRGGIVDEFRGLQALRSSFLPTQEEIAAAYAPQQMSPFQTALAVGAPFVQGLLAPSERGGGINAALAAASQAASQQLAAQREQKAKSDLLTKQALMEQRIKTGDFALTEALKRDAARKEQESKERIASRKQSSDGLTKLGKLQRELSAAEAANDETRAAQLRTAIQNELTKRTPLGADELEILKMRALDASGAQKQTSALVDQLDEDYSQLNELDQILGQISALSKRADAGTGGEFRKTALRGFRLLGSLVPELNAPLENLYNRLAGRRQEESGDLMTIDAAQRTIEALNAKLVLAFTKYFPGNLNKQELEVATKAAAGTLERDQKAVDTLRRIYGETLSRVRELKTGVDKIRMDYFEEISSGSPESRKLSQIDLLNRIQKYKLELQEKYREKDAAQVNIGDISSAISQSSVDRGDGSNFEISQTPKEAGATAKLLQKFFNDVAAKGQDRPGVAGNTLSKRPNQFVNPETLSKKLEEIIPLIANLRTDEGKFVKFGALNRETKRRAIQYLINSIEGSGQTQFALQDIKLPGTKDTNLLLPSKKTILQTLRDKLKELQ